jgi:MFS family permease
LIGKGSSYTEIGILYAIREITINLFEVPSGIIADTYGRKTALAGSFILYIISFVIFYFSSEFWIFLPAFIFFGIAEAFRTGTHKGMIMTYLAINNWGDQKINYYGHTRSWSQKGAALSSLAAGLIVFYSGDYERIFLYSTIPFVLNFFLILSYPEELDKIPEKQKIKHTAKLGITIKSFFKNLIKPEVLKIINMSAFHSAYLKAVKDYIQPLMVNVALLIPIMMNLEPDRKNGIIIGCLYFIIYLLNSFASRLAAKASEGERKKKISYITLLCGFTCGIACGIFYALNLWIISLIAFVGIFFIENLRKPILTGFIADNVPNQVLASVISIESQLKTVITAVIALLFGILADTMGIGKAFIVVTSCLLFFSLLINYSVKAGVFRNRKT